MSHAFAAQAERLVIVLVEPLYSGNIGATLRAMANMGLRRLVVVRPPALDPMRVRWMAPRCDALVTNMRIVGSVDEALEGCHRAVATCARHRRGTQPVLDPATFAAEHWDEPDPDTVTALLFGREDFGLSREDVDRCHQLVRIPTPAHASLNLGQAVLVLANHWFEAGRTRGVEATGRFVGGRRGFKPTRALDAKVDPKDVRATIDRLDPAADELVALLERVNYTRNTPADKVVQTARTAMQGAGLTVRQVEALRGMINKLNWGLDHPDKIER